MSRAKTCWKHCKELPLFGTGYLSVTGWIALLLMLLSLTVLVNAARAQGGVRDQRPVGGIPLKVAAAHQAHLRMVLVPDKPVTAEGNWEASSSMQVSQVDSVSHAYQALTAPQSSIAGSFFLVSDEPRY
jgi:hypothetical protein